MCVLPVTFPSLEYGLNLKADETSAATSGSPGCERTTPVTKKLRKFWTPLSISEQLKQHIIFLLVAKKGCSYGSTRKTKACSGRLCQRFPFFFIYNTWNILNMSLEFHTDFMFTIFLKPESDAQKENCMVLYKIRLHKHATGWRTAIVVDL
jgi:hypothetical protein